MTRREAAQRVVDMFARGFSIESEVHYIDKRDGVEKKSRLLSRPAGDVKWMVIYTRNEHGVFTAEDVRLFDAYTDATVDSWNRLPVKNGGLMIQTFVREV